MLVGKLKKEVIRLISYPLNNSYWQIAVVLWIPDVLNKYKALTEEAAWLKIKFSKKLWIAAELLLRGDDRYKLRVLEKLGDELQIPLCAAGGVYMHDCERRVLQDTITAIRLAKKINELGFDIESNGQRFLRPHQYPQEVISRKTYGINYTDCSKVLFLIG